MTDIFVEPCDPYPAHVQIAEQIRLACAQRQLRPGDPLPSIRRFARQLNVGAGVVRRAYRELRELGLLMTEARRFVVGPPAGAAASSAALVGLGVRRCDRMTAWARQHRMSAVGLGRLLLRTALVQEAASPSYLYVDSTAAAAARAVSSVSRAWGIPVAGLSLPEFVGRRPGAVRDVSAVLAGQHLYDAVVAAAGGLASRVFSVRVRLDDRVCRRIGRLPAASVVLLVCQDEGFSQTSLAMLRHCAEAFGLKRRFRAERRGDIADLDRLVADRRHGMVLFTPPVWDTLSARTRRNGAVAPAFCGPDPRSLEETRIAAGVLL